MSRGRSGGVRAECGSLERPSARIGWWIELAAQRCDLRAVQRTCCRGMGSCRRPCGLGRGVWSFEETFD
jgi:hypothetical protein